MCNEIIYTREPMTVFQDGLGGRWFQSTMSEIRFAVHRLNQRIFDDGVATLNDYYDELGLSRTEIGDSLGWAVSELVLMPTPILVPDESSSAISIAFNYTPTAECFAR